MRLFSHSHRMSTCLSGSFATCSSPMPQLWWRPMTLCQLLLHLCPSRWIATQSHRSPTHFGIPSPYTGSHDCGQADCLCNSTAMKTECKSVRVNLTITTCMMNSVQVWCSRRDENKECGNCIYPPNVVFIYWVWKESWFLWWSITIVNMVLWIRAET